MCGRFYLEMDEPIDDLIDLINRAEDKLRKTGSSLPRGEIRPGDCAAVIAMNRSLQRSVFPMRWGFKMDKRLLINARSETASQKPTFRSSMQERRCLVPASAYFEWDHRTKPLVKYKFEQPGCPLMYMAGLYRFEPESPQPVFTILTREAAPEIACFHDRMPVILPSSLTDAWLDRHHAPQTILSQAVTHVHWQSV